MKAYSVNSFFVCKITGAVVTEIQYTIDGENCVYLKNFTNEENANAYIYREKKDWLLNTLEKFVHHKKHIIQNNNDSAKAQALEICFDALKKFQPCNLKAICGSFIRGQKHFEAILPAPSNPSYESSAQVLTAIVGFCNNHLK